MSKLTNQSSRTFYKSSLKVLVFFVIVSFSTSCDKIDWPQKKHRAETHPSDVAVAWMNMQLRLTRSTPGFNSIVANRSYAYVGLSLYESIAPGMIGYRSIASQLSGSLTVPGADYGKDYYWPASANAALALISKSLFANTTPAMFSSMDSLEADFNARFHGKASEEELQRSIAFGKKIATAIFEWSKSDGGHEAYNNIISATYLPPVGPGLWIPTPPAFSKPFHNNWGNNRSFIPGLVSRVEPSPPPVYSELPTSDFYKAANEVYLTSLKLSSEDSVVAKFWADLPSNYNVPAHAANIVTQLVLLKKLSLAESAVLYCKHGIAGNDAIISCFATKYRYNVLRPVTYIRSVLGHPNWTPLIPTPPFPEYPSAHALVSAAFTTVLEEQFGKHFSFTDRTYENLYGTRFYQSFGEYANEAAISRVYGGIHYAFAATEGIRQGKKVGYEVNRLKFKK